jgi:hypothetical protein
MIYGARCPRVCRCSKFSLENKKIVFVDYMIDGARRPRVCHCSKFNLENKVTELVD